MARIITIVSDSHNPIVQQNMTSGYSNSNDDAMIDLVHDLHVFVSLMEQAYKNSTPIEQVGETKDQEITRYKQEIDKLLEKINKLKN